MQILTGLGQHELLALLTAHDMADIEAARAKITIHGEIMSEQNMAW